MLSTTVHLQLARERHEREIAEAARRRLIPRRRSPIRRTVGRSIIAIGTRLAAEPPLELARPR